MAEINLTMYVVLRPEELVCEKSVEESGMGELTMQIRWALHLQRSSCP